MTPLPEFKHDRKLSLLNSISPLWLPFEQSEPEEVKTIQRLEKDLARKEKALAEVAAEAEWYIPGKQCG